MKYPQWSTPANNVIHKFYNSDITVFVEGKDDVNFWHHKFEQFAPNIKFHVEAVHKDGSSTGGRQMLAVKMKDIIENNGRFIVASDKDYNFVINSIPDNPLIITTYGYAIENSLLCPQILNRALCKKLHNFSIDETVSISAVIYNVCESLKNIIIYDIANEYYQKGKQVLAESPFQYIENNGMGCSLKMKKLGDKIKDLEPFFSDEEKLFIITKLESTPQDLRYIIRGHFLMRVIYNLFYTLLKNYGYSEQFSMNDFYYAIVDECQAKCNCTDMRHLKEKIESAVKCLISEGALGVGE